MNDIMIQMPKNVENMALPDPELVLFYNNLENRIFWLEDEITPEDTLAMSKQIIAWNREDSGKPIKKRKPIKIFFFCPGGDLDTSYTLMDTIKLSKTPVWGINMGQCASGAAYTFISCHKRFMVPHSYFLFHQGSGSFNGNFDQVCYQIQNYQEQVQHLSEFMINNTKYTKEEIEKNICTEWYIYADEAVAHGVCDEVIENFEDIL